MFVEKAADVAAEDRAEVSPAVQARAFDALFHRALGAEPGLLAVLESCGYDARHPAPAYSSATWTACVEMARRHLFASVPFEEGMRALGRLFADGFASTPIGQVYQGVAYTGRAYVAKLPQLLKLARPDLDLQLSFEAEQRCRIFVRGPHPQAEFFAGLIEARVRQRGLPAAAEVTRSDASGYDLLVTW